METKAPDHAPLLDRLTIGLFLLALVLPGGLLLLGHSPSPISIQAEQRNLAPLPSLALKTKTLQAFPAAFEAWFMDRFGLRDVLIRNHSRLVYFGLRASPSPKVVLGVGDWLFLKGTPDVDGEPLEDGRGTKPLIPYQLERWRWQLQDEYDWLAHRGIAFVFGLVPDKGTVYPEKLPLAWRNRGRMPAYVQLDQHLRRCLTFSYLSLKQPMLDAKTNAIVYRLTDTHWNDEGCWVGLQQLIAALRPRFPQLPVPDRAAQIISDYRCLDGDLSRLISLTGEADEHFDTIRPRVEHATITKLVDNPLSDIESVQANTNLPSLLFFHDSYGHFLKPFLPEYFSRTRFRWTSQGLEDALVESFHPDVVFHLIAERRARFGQRYPIAVQQEAWAARYAGAAPRLAWDPAALATRLHPGAATQTSLSEAGLVAQARGAHALDFDLPVSAHSDVPVIALDLTSSHNAELSLVWDTQRPELWPAFMGREVKVYLTPGRNKVYLPIVDPEFSGHARLLTNSRARVLTFHRFEVRTVPRYPDGTATQTL